VTLLLIQMSTVLLTTFLCGLIARKLGQARVIGEIIGGILIGPSALGRIAPHASARLFPLGSLGAFEVLSNVGLILFLFLIGSELNYEHLGRQKRTTILAICMSIFLPFLMAAVVTPSLHVRFAPSSIGRIPFFLFLGISMSITAFPVLARILQERNLQSTPLGTTALMCAAVADLMAWILLGIALTLIPHSSQSISLPHRLAWLCVYLLVMLFVVRPVSNWFVHRKRSAHPPYEFLAAFVIVVLASSAATEAIGVHPLFGAFIGGVCFPRIKYWQSDLRTRLEMVVSALLMPLFFALTGLRTRLDLLSGASIWFWTAAVLVIAVAGKMIGAVLAARWTGQSWRYALALGALLNTRGLVELVVLNIAYDAHVFSPTLFTMLVMMALLTTMITTPILNLLGIDNPGQDARSLAGI
jgi:Kef-type K+ transport system membrane component KefB